MTKNDLECLRMTNSIWEGSRELKKLKNAKNVRRGPTNRQTDRPTDGPTKRSTRLKTDHLEWQNIFLTYQLRPVK